MRSAGNRDILERQRWVFQIHVLIDGRDHAGFQNGAYPFSICSISPFKNTFM